MMTPSNVFADITIEFAHALFWALVSVTGCIVLGRRILRRILGRR